MRNKPIRSSLVVLLPILIGLFFGTAGADDSKTWPLNTTDGTQPHGVMAEKVTYRGQEGLSVTVLPDHKGMDEGGCDNCTYLLVDKGPFKNGTIDIDLAGSPSQGAPAWARGFVGVVFRVKNDHSQWEGFYLRPMNALEKGPRRNFSFQYFSYPDFPWKRLRDEFPGKYEGYADVKPGQWVHLRIEVQEASAKFYINGKLLLALDEMLGGPDLSGGIGLFTEPQTDAYFSNLKVSYASK